MLEKNITIKGIFIAILFITLGFSQASLTIENVDTDAGTLDIYMSNTIGCSYCPVSTYNNNTQNWVTQKGFCELPVSGGDATWVSYENITEAACSAIPSLDGNGGWWFDGEVGGFQFQILGATVTGATGGSASDLGFNVSTTPVDPITTGTNGVPNVLAFSLTGATIPVGSNVLLTQITFTDFNNGDICFGEDLTSSDNNTISDAIGGYIGTTWGGCYCGSASQNDADGDSICNDDDTCPYDENNDADGDGVCGDEDDCWGGVDVVVDACGICGGSITSSDECPCDSGVEMDCVGVCGGLSVIDCAGTCGGSAVDDACGVCGGSGPPTNYNCDGNCTNLDCAGVCGGGAVEDVCGTCGGSIAEVSACGVGCTSTGEENLNTHGLDCNGACNGSAVNDTCGVCGGTGPPDNYNCQGQCTAGVDCNGQCGGALLGTGDGIGNDQCGICGGGGPLENYNCQGQCINLAVCGLSISQIGSNLPAEFSISQNFPNPFNPVTSITFDVAEMDKVSLIVYDLTGKEVVTLVSGTYTPGTYNVEWNAVNNAGDGIVSGMYIYRYISSEKAITRKMLYLK